MPTVFRKNGFTFSFYSNDHKPIHIHVSKGDGEAKFNVEPYVELVESAGLKTKELSEVEDIISDNTDLIIQTWNDFFNS